MAVNLRHRSFLKELDFTPDEFRYLIDLAAQLKATKGNRPARATQPVGPEHRPACSRSRQPAHGAAFEVAAHDQGAHVTYLGSVGVANGAQGIDQGHRSRSRSHVRRHRVPGRCPGVTSKRSARHAGVPVWNGLTDQWHPTQMLADVLTMREHSTDLSNEIAYCYLGDARNNTARSLLMTGALLGMDVRLAAPQRCGRRRASGPRAELGEHSGAQIGITEDAIAGVAGVDFIYTDVWVSMGEPADEWDERIDELLPYQVNAALMHALRQPGCEVPALPSGLAQSETRDR